MFVENKSHKMQITIKNLVIKMSTDTKFLMLLLLYKESFKNISMVEIKRRIANKTV